MRRRRTALAAAALVVAAGPALALDLSYSSSASITGSRYRLIDLRPDDGIAPSVTFLDGGAASSSALYSPDGSPAAVDNTGWIFTYDAALATGVELGSARAAASLSFNGVGPSLSAAGAAMGDGTPDAYHGEATTGGHGLNAILSPYTAIRWTGSYTLSAQSYAGPIGTSWREGAVGEIAWGMIDTVVGNITETRSVTAWANPLRGPHAAHEEGSFSFILRNTTDQAFNVGASLTARAFSGVPPIPEPSTYALMAAGLGVVGVVTRRRKQTSE